MAHCKQNPSVFNSYSTIISLIANLTAGGERAAKTAQSTYLSYHDMIITQLLNWRQSCEIERRGFWW